MYLFKTQVICIKTRVCANFNMDSESGLVDAQMATMDPAQEKPKAQAMGSIRQACVAASIVSTQFVQVRTAS